MRVLIGLTTACLLPVLGNAALASVRTTSGLLQGVNSDGVATFKGIRYAQSPTGARRWAPPVAFTSSARQNATEFGPSCTQQFAFPSGPFTESLFNNPPLPEDEDCLFLNVFAPSSFSLFKKPVIVWIHGGSLAFGSSSVPQYNGTSFAKDQGIILVSINYRTNVFGFPSSPDLPLVGNNLGFLDQELALQWVQTNIARFGGDPAKVTVMGQSAGSSSIAQAIARHVNPPFRAAVMLSGASGSTRPTPSFVSFNNFATAVGCGASAIGPERLACLKAVPASTIRTYINGPSSGGFRTVVDNVTVFADPLERIRARETARVPILLGSTQDDGSLFTLGQTDLAAFLNSTFGPAAAAIPPDAVRSLYPGLDDGRVIAAAFRDFVFQCPTELWANAFTQSGFSNIFRYIYGPVFADLQAFPGAGAWHGTEIPEIFGTFFTNSASPDEVTLSRTLQTAMANFARNPTKSPAANWPKYVPGNATKTLAKIAYQGNVDPGNFVVPTESSFIDLTCDMFWNSFLTSRT